MSLLYGIDPRTGDRLEPPVAESTLDEVGQACAAAASAEEPTLETRAGWLNSVADILDGAGAELIAAADAETALGTARLTGELARTTGQLRLLAAEVLRPDFAEVVTDDTEPGFRRKLFPIGPVAVYAASNFPFAFSVAGGDTGSALAAGCPVVVKAHPGHPRTSQRTAALVGEVLPEGVFGLVHGIEAGRLLIGDPRIRAAAFTGSQAGGRALFDAACARPDPIPFYGELGSVNPVFVTRAAVAARGPEIAAGYVASFTLGAGQFCTNPGLVFLPAGHGLSETLAEAVRRVPAAPMLTPRITTGYHSGVERLASIARPVAGTGDGPRLFTTSLAEFAGHPELSEECFGPASLIVEYSSEDDLVAAAGAIPGSLAATVHAEAADGVLARRLIGVLARRAGRIVWNGWPTGVAVNRAMHHGGPWPATTSPLHTSVGTLAIRRFQVPVVFQGVPGEFG